jgi:dTDP-4-amino-4,6-dideoxygalactose transaminase
VLIDSAESLGSLYKETPAASLGAISILSFNSNKLVTTTGGGAILTNNEQLASTIRKLSNQARENFHWYEHSEIGYNYRLSPILAALGMSQLSRIDKIVEKRRKIRQTYKDNLELLEGIQVSTDSIWEKSNAWLTTIKIKKKNYANGRDLIYESLAKSKIEARFIWKPLHMQPVFSNSECSVNGTSESAFYTSLCLPSSQNLSYDRVLEICDIVKDSLTGK